jgi:hypothetical protein
MAGLGLGIAPPEDAEGEGGSREAMWNDASCRTERERKGRRGFSQREGTRLEIGGRRITRQGRRGGGSPEEATWNASCKTERTSSILLTCR